MTTLEIDQPLDTPSAEGWFDDPTGEHHQRFFDGEQWTDHVTHTGPLPCSGCQLT